MNMRCVRAGRPPTRPTDTTMTPRPDPHCALTRASSAQQDAADRGFDWTDPLDALEKVREEADEVARAAAGPAETGGDAPAARLREEVGDLLFAVVNVARLGGVDPADALARATRKFERRYAEVRRIARDRGLPMPGTPLEPLDRIWDEVKARERGGERGG